MNDKKQPSNRQLKVGQQIRFLVSNFLIKEDFIFDNFDSKNLTTVLEGTDICCPEVDSKLLAKWFPCE